MLLLFVNSLLILEKKYIKRYYHRRPSMVKFVELMNTNSDQERFRFMIFVNILLNSMKISWSKVNIFSLSKLFLLYNDILRNYISFYLSIILTSYLFYCMHMCILAFTLTIFKELT